MISCIQNKMPTRSSHISCVLIATQWRVAGKKCCLQSELIVKWLPTGGQTMMGTLWGTSRQPHHAIMNTLTEYQVDNLLFICYVDVWAAVVDIFISEGRGRRHLPLFIICGHIMPGLNNDWMPPRLARAHWPPSGDPSVSSHSGTENIVIFCVDMIQILSRLFNYTRLRHNNAHNAGIMLTTRGSGQQPQVHNTGNWLSHQEAKQ